MTKKLLRALPLIALAGALAGCGQGSKSGTASLAPPPGTVLVTVNGEPITANEVNAYVQLRTHGHQMKLNDQQRHQIAQQLIQVVLAAQDAQKKGLAKNSDVQAQMALQRNLLLASEAVNNYMSNATVPESALKKQYEQMAKQQSGKEYKARHILVKTKAKAEKIIAELKKGANFAALAKKDSTGPSAKQGGELGWFKPNQMVPAFSAAVAKLKPGEYTKTPVKTQYGWHVIKLEKERTAAPPSYSSMKPALENQEKGKMVQSYLGKLKSQASIDWKVANPASAAAPATAMKQGMHKMPAPTTAKKPATH